MIHVALFTLYNPGISDCLHLIRPRNIRTYNSIIQLSIYIKCIYNREPISYIVNANIYDMFSLFIIMFYKKLSLYFNF